MYSFVSCGHHNESVTVSDKVHFLHLLSSSMSLVAPGNPVSGSLSVIPKKKDNFKTTPNKHTWILSLFTKL